jgi:Colicin E5 ribonuclease domain
MDILGTKAYQRAFARYLRKGTPIEPVYPELLILPLLRVPALIAAWRAWAFQRQVSKSWKLGSHKSATKWRNRLEKGDWTPEKITRIIREGKAHKAPNNVNRSHTATRYELGNDFVVIDDMTKDVLQVSEPGYIPKKF